MPFFASLPTFTTSTTVVNCGASDQTGHEICPRVVEGLADVFDMPDNLLGRKVLRQKICWVVDASYLLCSKGPPRIRS